MDTNFIVGALIVVGFIVGAVFYFRKHAAQEAIAKAYLADMLTKLEAIGASIKAHTAAVAPTPVVVPPVTPGKSGTPGTFSAPVTGDPSTDLPAITAAYLAK